MNIELKSYSTWFELRRIEDGEFLGTFHREDDGFFYFRAYAQAKMSAWDLREITSSLDFVNWHQQHA